MGSLECFTNTFKDTAASDQCVSLLFIKIWLTTPSTATVPPV